jgi:hypothetical protein
MDELNLGIEAELPVSKKPKVAPEKVKKEVKKVEKKKVKKVTKPVEKAAAKKRGPKPEGGVKKVTMNVAVHANIPTLIDANNEFKSRSVFVEKAVMILLKIMPIIKKDTTEIRVEAGDKSRVVKL